MSVRGVKSEWGFRTLADDAARARELADEFEARLLNATAPYEHDLVLSVAGARELAGLLRRWPPVR